MLSEITHEHPREPAKTIGQLNLLIREVTAEMRTKQKGVVISIDLEKAYDSINHKFMQKAMEAAGLGNNFRGFYKKI